MLKKTNFFLILLILVSLIPLLDLFRPGFPQTHDGRDHVVRIANFYQSLSEGNIIPRWAKNLNWRYGHPVLMFFYPFSSYLGSFFRFLGFSFINSTKIVFGLGFTLSGLFMYLWIKELWGKEAGLIASLIYLFAPYRFVDLYVRGAIGECTAFLWPPLICWFALKFSKKHQWHYLVGGALSVASLILSHNALSIMFLPVILGYMALIVYSSAQNKKFLLMIHYSLFIIFGFALSAFFWFPAFFEAKYTLRDIVMKGTFGGFEPFSRLILPSWSYGGTGVLSVQLGIWQWLIIIIAPFLVWSFLKQKKREWTLLLFLFICFWLTIFLILPISKVVYNQVALLRKFQFAWRFLSLSLFPPAVFSGALIYSLPQKTKTSFICLLVLSLLLLNRNYWHPRSFLTHPDSFYWQFQAGTTNDTGESAPRWSIRFMEKYPQGPMEIIEGEGEIKEVSRLTNKHVYQLEARKKSRIVENTLYFPGWQVFVDGQEVEVEFQDPAYRGLMTFWVNPGLHQIVIRFGETKLRLFADLVSLLSLLTLLSWGVIIKIRQRK